MDYTLTDERERKESTGHTKQLPPMCKMLGSIKEVK